MIKKLLICLVLAIASLAVVASAQATPVSLELALLVDVSASVDSTEFTLQRTGYVDAFNNLYDTPGVGSIAATFIYWSGAAEQSQVVPWTLLTDDASSTAFATAIGNAARPFSGFTGPGSAINFAYPLFSNNGYEGSRLVIDVSGDGAENVGDDTSDARDAAIAAGITAINGLPILGESGLQAWYQANIVSSGGFLEVANSFDDFGTAVGRKINREVVGNGVPEPASMILFGIGLFGAARLRRKR